MKKRTERNKPAEDGGVIYFGIDFHKEMTEIAIISDKDGRIVGRQKLSTNLGRIRHYIEKNTPEGCEALVCYEASCCGYGLYRHLRRYRINCDVIAPHTVEKSLEDRQKKNDRRDASQLGRQLRSGVLKKVSVPSEEHETIRRYIRLANDLNMDSQRLKTKMSLLLLCMGIAKPEKTTNWSNPFRSWLRKLDINPTDKLVLEEHLAHLEYLEVRISDIIRGLCELVRKGGGIKTVCRLMSLRGVGILTAVTLWGEIYDFRRFPNARSFMSYIGLDCYEHSSGGTERRGRITKLGNSHCRRVIVQAATSYKSQVKMSKDLKRRQEGQPAEVVAKSWGAQKRLYKRYWYLSHKKGSAGKARVAVARELSGFIWGIMQIEAKGNETVIREAFNRRVLEEVQKAA